MQVIFLRVSILTIKIDFTKISKALAGWFKIAQILEKSIFVFRNRIHQYPLYLDGSGSTSGNVELDPRSKKTLDKLAKINPNYKNIIPFF